MIIYFLKLVFNFVRKCVTYIPHLIRNLFMLLFNPEEFISFWIWFKSWLKTIFKSCEHEWEETSRRNRFDPFFFLRYKTSGPFRVFYTCKKCGHEYYKDFN